MFLLDKSGTTLEDRKEVSQAAQEAKLDRELRRFEEELELFLIDKDQFLEDLYRRLKQITSLWKSWRCQRLRDISVTQLVSAKQIEDLIHWEQNLPGKKKTITKIGKPTDMLIRFLQACLESRQLYEQFLLSIYKPLHLFFSDDKAAPFSEALGRVLEKWSYLLEPGPIDHRLLSAESSEAVHNMNLSKKPRDTNFNLILRLVPDFAVKGFEALYLARQWRALLGYSGYIRELKFIQIRRQRRSREHISSEPANVPVPFSIFHNLERKLNQSKDRYKTVDPRNHVTKAVLHHETHTNTNYGVQGTFARSANDDTKFTSFTRESNEQRIHRLQTDLKREQLQVQRLRNELLHVEIASRYMREPPMLRPLFDILASTKGKCRMLRNEISKQACQPDCAFDKIPDSRGLIQSSKDSFTSERKRLASRALLTSWHRAQPLRNNL